MTSSRKINLILRHEEHFLGTYHVNRLPQFPLEFPRSFIILTNNHWVAVNLVNERECLYFDSFGELIKDEKLILYLSIHYKYVTISRLKIQDNNSVKCAQFCMAFIKIVSSKKSFRHFLNMFDEESCYINDLIVDAFLK